MFYLIHNFFSHNFINKIQHSNQIMSNLFQLRAWNPYMKKWILSKDPNHRSPLSIPTACNSAAFCTTPPNTNYPDASSHRVVQMPSTTVPHASHTNASVQTSCMNVPRPSFHRLPTPNKFCFSTQPVEKRKIEEPNDFPVLKKHKVVHEPDSIVSSHNKENFVIKPTKQTVCQCCAFNYKRTNKNEP